MGMNMKNGLPGIRAGVEDNPIPRLEQPLKLRDLPSSHRNIGKKLRVSGGKLPQVPIPGLGHNKHMNLRLRPNIPESKGPIVLIDNISRDLPGNDPLEESLILTHEKHPTDPTRPTRRAPSEDRGGPGLAPAGVWGSDPQKTQRTRSGPLTEAKRGEGGRGAVDPGGRSTATAAAAGPRGEVPGGVCAFPVARGHRKRCVAR
jgi:hypothetical protein